MQVFDATFWKSYCNWLNKLTFCDMNQSQFMCWPHIRKRGAKPSTARRAPSLLIMYTIHCSKWRHHHHLETTTTSFPANAVDLITCDQAVWPRWRKLKCEFTFYWICQAYFTTIHVRSLAVLMGLIIWQTDILNKQMKHECMCGKHLSIFTTII